MEKKFVHELIHGEWSMLKIRNTVISLIYVRCYASKNKSFEGNYNMIIRRTHLQDLKDVTSDVHYESFRAQQLLGKRNLNNIYE